MTRCAGVAEAAGVAGAQTGPARPAAPVLHCYQTCMLHLVVVGYTAELPPATALRGCNVIVSIKSAQEGS